MRVEIPDALLSAWPEELSFSTGHGCANKFQTQRLASAEFIAHVCSHRVGPKDGSAWSPFSFSNGIRRAANCVGADTVVLDVDEGATFRQIRASFAMCNLAATVVTTHSHLPTKPKFRIIVPLAKRFSVADYASVKEAAADWKRLGLALARELEIRADPNALLLSQFFFDPRHPAGSEPIVKWFEGAALDAEKLLEKAQEGESYGNSQQPASMPIGNAQPRNGLVAANPFRRDGKIDLDVVRSAMKAIKNDERFSSRNDWIKVCGALHCATGGSADGMEMFEEWCATWTDGESNEAENEHAWNSMRKDRPNISTAASLVRLAKRDGWTPPDWIEEPIEFTDVREARRLAGAPSDRKPDIPDADESKDLAPNPIAHADLEFTGAGSDTYNGGIFARFYQDKLLFIHETGDVLRFDEEGGWLAASPGTAERAAKAVVQILKRAANDEAQLKHVTKLYDLRYQKAMIEMARSEKGMTRQLSDFDSDPMLLGVTNGVLDLIAGRLSPVSPRLLVSKRAYVAFDPTAHCPRFEQFLKEVQPDREVRAFLPIPTKAPVYNGIMAPGDSGIMAPPFYEMISPGRRIR